MLLPNLGWMWRVHGGRHDSPIPPVYSPAISYAPTIAPISSVIPVLLSRAPTFLLDNLALTWLSNDVMYDSEAFMTMTIGR